jgi:hypothetical protein
VAFAAISRLLPEGIAAVDAAVAEHLERRVIPGGTSG